MDCSAITQNGLWGIQNLPPLTGKCYLKKSVKVRRLKKVIFS